MQVQKNDLKKLLGLGVIGFIILTMIVPLFVKEGEEPSKFVKFFQDIQTWFTDNGLLAIVLVLVILAFVYLTKKQSRRY